MLKSAALEIIDENYTKERPVALPRDVEIKIPEGQKAVAIIGPRRAGKTYLLFHLARELGKTSEKNQIMYLNLEDERLAPLTVSDLNVLMKTYYEKYPENKKKKLHLFLDEVQNLEGWERFTRGAMDKENIQIYLTGSSSRLLAKEIATSMRGRSLSYYLLPFSFREFLSAKNISVQHADSPERKAVILNALGEYMEFGGFPEVVIQSGKDMKLRILRDYTEVMLLKDIVERHGIKNTVALRALFNTLLHSFSKEFSANVFYNRLKSQGIKIGKNTLYSYIQHFEDSFAILALRKFSYKPFETKQSIPKIYSIDTGYTAISGENFSPNSGRLLENAAALEMLRRKFGNPLMEFYYWQDAAKKEVDFVVKEGTKVSALMQVCYDVEDFQTKEREIKALLKAGKELRCDNLTILTWDYENEEKTGGKRIAYVPAWKWLLGMR